MGSSILVSQVDQRKLVPFFGKPLKQLPMEQLGANDMLNSVMHDSGFSLPLPAVHWWGIISQRSFFQKWPYSWGCPSLKLPHLEAPNCFQQPRLQLGFWLRRPKHLWSSMAKPLPRARCKRLGWMWKMLLGIFSVSLLQFFGIENNIYTWSHIYCSLIFPIMHKKYWTNQIYFLHILRNSSKSEIFEFSMWPSPFFQPVRPSETMISWCENLVYPWKSLYRIMFIPKGQRLWWFPTSNHMIFWNEFCWNSLGWFWGAQLEKNRNVCY